MGTKFYQKTSKSDRHPDVLDRDRAEVPFSAVSAFYDLLEKTLEDLDLFQKPHCIFNADETGFSGKQSVKGKVFVKKGTRHPHQRMTSFSGHTTVLVTASASGEILPPLVIFEKSVPAGDLQVPPTWRACASESGYIRSDLFLLWLKECFLPHCGRDRPVLLIIDNHVSHVTPDAIKFAQENRIELLCLPPHSTHLLQPLDIGYFGRLKAEVARRSVGLGYAGMRCLPKNKFPKLLQHAIDAISPSTVAAAFKHAGIMPFDRSNGMQTS